jgi:hypothetical protein
MSTGSQDTPIKPLVVVPVPGRRVRNPENGMAPITGETVVPRNAFWMKRIALGDVELVQKSSSKPKSK